MCMFVCHIKVLVVGKGREFVCQHVALLLMMKEVMRVVMRCF
jgi:hypothetical protein